MERKQKREYSEILADTMRRNITEHKNRETETFNISYLRLRFAGTKVALVEVKKKKNTRWSRNVSSKKKKKSDKNHRGREFCFKRGKKSDEAEKE